MLHIRLCNIPSLNVYQSAVVMGHDRLHPPTTPKEPPAQCADERKNDGTLPVRVVPISTVSSYHQRYGKIASRS